MNYRSALLVCVTLVASSHALAQQSPVQKKVPHKSNPDKLWEIVHQQCDVDMHDHQKPEPCTIVDDKRGFAVLKDIEGKGQYLLIPTAKVTGIDSPSVLASDAPNYFADAWENHGRVGEAYGVSFPVDDLSLAINSKVARSQNQLHIHIDCLKPEVKVALHYMLPLVTTDWTALPQALVGHPYRAMRINGQDLSRVYPFQLLAHSLQAPETEMQDHTLALVPETFPDGIRGYVLLDGKVDLAHGDKAEAENIQDHACAIANSDPLVASTKSAM